MALNITAVATMRRNRAPEAFQRAPTTLVLEGPFRFCRNPIYLAGILVLIGLALMLGSFGALLFPGAPFLSLQEVHVPMEERQMVLIFGERYLA